MPKISSDRFRNDTFREKISECQVVFSDDVINSGLSMDILKAVREYYYFEDHNNSEDSHDFGVIFLHNAYTVFWFIEEKESANYINESASSSCVIRILFDYEI